MPGATTSGSAFATDAVARGAVAVVADRAAQRRRARRGGPASRGCAACSPRRARPSSGTRSPSLDLVGVTGTNGKTTVTTLVARLARALGWNGASDRDAHRRAHDAAAPELFRSLAAARRDFEPGAAAVGRRARGLEPRARPGPRRRADASRSRRSRTSSHDHLDYHRTMEDYFAAKASLFTPEHAQRAVVWVDDPYGARLGRPRRRCRWPRCAAPTPRDVSATLARHDLLLARPPGRRPPLVGGYNVDNALRRDGRRRRARRVRRREVAGARWPTCSAVPGRFEVVARERRHGPRRLRAHARRARAPAASTCARCRAGRVVAVFGCGGDRDHAKRPVMGAVASRSADVIVVTSDNPRGESPEAIIDAIVAGVDGGAPTSVREVGSAPRRSREALAMRGARRRRRGRRQGPRDDPDVRRDRVVAFDDREVVRELLRGRRAESDGVGRRSASSSPLLVTPLWIRFLRARSLGQQIREDGPVDATTPRPGRRRWAAWSSSRAAVARLPDGSRRHVDRLHARRACSAVAVTSRRAPRPRRRLPGDPQRAQPRSHERAASWPASWSSP